MNLTSLIDVTFLLIVFFVLVSRLNEIEQIEMNLPSPAGAATEVLESERQVVINVVPGASGSAAAFRVGVTDFTPDASGLEAMTAHMAGLYQLNPRIDVNIRADRLTRYEHIEPVIGAVSVAARSAVGDRAGASARVNLAVVREP